MKMKNSLRANVYLDVSLQSLLIELSSARVTRFELYWGKRLECVRFISTSEQVVQDMEPSLSDII